MTDAHRTFRPLHSVDATVLDLFCGAGGSSRGASNIPGVRIAAAANHNKLDIQTHNTNFPHADHYLTDISMSRPTNVPQDAIPHREPRVPLAVACARRLAPARGPA